jgi:hypothetical protein
MFEQTAICLIDAATEAPPLRIGTIISCYRDRASAQLEEIAFKAGERYMPRTRLLRLKRALAPGSAVHPDDLAPVTAG